MGCKHQYTTRQSLTFHQPSHAGEFTPSVAVEKVLTEIIRRVGLALAQITSGGSQAFHQPRRFRKSIIDGSWHP